MLNDVHRKTPYVWSVFSYFDIPFLGLGVMEFCIFIFWGWISKNHNFNLSKFYLQIKNLGFHYTIIHFEPRCSKWMWKQPCFQHSGFIEQLISVGSLWMFAYRLSIFVRWHMRYNPHRHFAPCVLNCVGTVVSPWRHVCFLETILGFADSPPRIFFWGTHQ